MPAKPKSDPNNPILNSPYEEPGLHYSTDQAGNLDYDNVREGRRIFTPDTPTVPLAQQESVETAIWLNEIAERSNAGTHVLGRLTEAQRTVSDDPARVLPRIAFKMATGSGKTVVMACLILYHFLNRRQYRNELMEDWRLCRTNQIPRPIQPLE